jgi:hypothetical protein
MNATIILSKTIETVCLLIGLGSSQSSIPGLEVPVPIGADWKGFLRLANPDLETIGVDPLQVSKRDLEVVLGIDGDEALGHWRYITKAAARYLDHCLARSRGERSRSSEAGQLGTWLQVTAPTEVSRLVCYPCVSVWPNAYGVAVGRTLNVVYPITKDPGALVSSTCHEWAHVWLRQEGVAHLPETAADEGLAILMGQLLAADYRGGVALPPEGKKVSTWGFLRGAS